MKASFKMWTAEEAPALGKMALLQFGRVGPEAVH